MRSNGLALAIIRNALAVFVLSCSICALSFHSTLAATTGSGDNSATPIVAGTDVVIGINDFGRFTISDGSTLSSNNVTIGNGIPGIGYATVTDFVSSTGATTTWTMKNLIVGNAGTGRLEILNGGIVNIDYTATPGAGDLIVGNTADSVSMLIVSGLGSTLRIGDDTVIGQLGAGTLRIADNGYVLAANYLGSDQDIFTVGSHGRLELDNGWLRTQFFTNFGAVTGSGRLESSNTITNNTIGHIDVKTGDRLTVTAAIDNKGAVSFNGGEIEFYKTVTNSFAGAEVTLKGGAIARFVLPTTGFGFDSTAGVLATTGGSNDIYGTVRIQSAASKISVSGGSTAVFHDLVTNTGGTIEVFPGSSIVYLQGLTTSGSGSALAVSLGDSGTNNSSIQVSGDASLAGNLNISLAPGFKPSAGDVFPVLAATGAVTGTLNLVAAPALPGGMLWNLGVTSSGVSLTVVATGDYNGNGIVDTSDYIVWRKSIGQQGAGLAADSNGDGIVNIADYNFWRSRVGTTTGGGSGLGTTAAVPEPAMMGVLGAVFASLGSIRRRKSVEVRLQPLRATL